MNASVITSIIAVVAALSGMLIGWLTMARNNRNAIKEESKADAFVRADVEYIKRGVDDIRLEQRQTAKKLDELGERVTRVEVFTEGANERFRRLEKIKQI